MFISPAFVEMLVLPEWLLTLSRIHASGISGSSSSDGNLSRSSSPVHAADNPSRSSGSLLRCITSKSARNTSVKIFSIKLFANQSLLGNCLASFPTASYPRQVTQSTVLLLRWCHVPGGAAAAIANLFSVYFLDLLLS